MTDPKNPPTILRRIVRRTGIVVVSAGVLAGAVFAVGLGAGIIAERAQATEPAIVAEATPVSVRRLEIINGFSVMRSYVGQIEPSQTADLSFEFGGRLAEILVDEGAEVTKGQVVARLDTDLLRADKTGLQATRDALGAQLKFANQSLDRSLELQKRGFAPEERLDQARATRDELVARIAETDSALETVQIRLGKSNLTAPFDGLIGLRAMDTGATVTGGQAVVRLLQTKAPIFRVGLPLSIQPQELADLTVQIGGTQYPAALDQVRPDIDPTTRTRTALITVDVDAQTAYGQTARLIVDRTIETPGAWVPLRALREDTGGLWSILLVGDDMIVRPAAVELIHADADKAYVRGSFQTGAQLIDTGPQRVTPGQYVQIIGGS